ncbi:MAG TPA: M1 family metallopeptidase [Symbiobacteriaceae bacterium]|nr:M1 family metallopeptidase [Symbiobacteriaceae bacterium]
MLRRLLVFCLLLAVTLSAAACSKPTEVPLRWTGEALEGAQFAAREFDGVTVHYAPPTYQDQAERLANAAAGIVKNHRQWGRITRAERLHLWLVPKGRKWPAGLAAAPPWRQVRAAAPMAVVALEEEAARDAAAAGLPEAVAVAVTQSAGSPVFQVDWLHEGTGGAFNTDPLSFPGAVMKRAHERVKLTGQMLGLLRAERPSGDALYRAAATALATLVMDRWGVSWSSQFPKQAAELTPGAALLWATGAPTEVAALQLWQERMEQAAALAADARLQSMADMSPVRAVPKLSRLPPGPGPNDNYSPHAYHISARYEPEQRRLSGEEQLSWENGESIPIDTLYFNLWPNADQYARFGSAISVESVSVDGKPAAHTAQGLDLVVPLGRPVEPGGKVTVGITFTTRLPGLISPRVLGQTEERFNLAHWFPILAVLDDRGWNLHAFPEFPGEPYSENAHFRVRLDVPAGITVAATGHPTGKTEQAGRWIYEWDAPNFKDWIAAAGKGMHEETRQVGGVTLRVIDGDPAVARTILGETERAFRLFEDQFGAYAYPDLVVVPCCAWLEYPGLFYTESSASARGNWWHTVLYHELAHQWFFGMVGNDQYGEAWLDEGFARYGERYGARTFGFTDQLRDIRSRQIPPQVHVNSSTAAFNIYGGYTAAVYDLGAVLLEDLEERLGKAKFRQFLHRWTDTYRFKTATTTDFVRMAEAVAGEDLSSFFRSHRIDPGAREPYRAVLPLGQVKPK